MRTLGIALLLAAAGWCAAGEPVKPPTGSDLADLSLEQLMEVEVVYGASRYAQRASEAPSSVTIITAAEIRQFGYRTLADVLRSVQGFAITYDRNYAYVGVRGFGRPGDYNTRVLVLVDGHRINDNVYDEALVDNGFVIDLDLIDRVEVVRGPSFSIYGTSAFFPVVVNVITRRPAQARPEAAATAESFGTYSGRVAYGGRLAGGVELEASASLLDSRGQNLYFKEYDTPESNNGVAVHADDERAYRLFARASLGKIAVEAAYAMREKGIPTGSFGTVFGDRRARTWDGRGFLDVKGQHRVGASVTLFGRAYYDYMSYRGDYPTDYPPVTLNRDTGEGEWWGVETFALYSGLAHHTIVAGGEFIADTRQDQSNFDVEPPASYLDLHGSGRRWALFAQDEVRLSPKVILSLGLRHDWLPRVGAKDSPRVAVILNPSAATSLKLLFGRAFRPPNQYELYYATDVPAQAANPDLAPETIASYELVLDRRLGSGVHLTGSLFFDRIEGLVTYTTNPSSGAFQYRNADDIESRGLEVALSGSLGRSLNGRFSYSFQDARDVDHDLSLSNSPRHLVKADLGAPLWGDRLSAGLEAQYTSARLTLGGNRLGGFAVANATLLASHLGEGLELSASVYNLFDRRYADPASEEHIEDAIPQDGRSFRLKLRWRP